MAKSFYGNGGAGVVTTTNTSSNPAYGLVSGVAEAVAAALDDDAIALNALTICHTGTTDGSTASASWLKVQIVGSGSGKLFTDIILPGERRAYKEGFDKNEIGVVKMWTLTAGSNTSPGPDNVQAIVGGMVKLC